jgi:hypothetical protein
MWAVPDGGHTLMHSTPSICTAIAATCFINCRDNPSPVRAHLLEVDPGEAWAAVHTDMF